jgi:hypothetical protein
LGKPALNLACLLFSRPPGPLYEVSKTGMYLWANYLICPHGPGCIIRGRREWFDKSMILKI